MIDHIASLWFAKAEADMKTVKILLKDPEHNPEIVCFHCQQAVEKYCKGFLATKNIAFPKTHDLRTLYELCVAIESGFKVLDRYQLSLLTDYAVENRYPDDQYIPNKTEVQTFVALTAQVKELVLKLAK